MENLFPTLCPAVMSSLDGLDVEVCFLDAAGGWILFCIHSVSLCLFIEELRPLILRGINDQ